MSVGIVFSQTTRRKLRDRLARELAQDSSSLVTRMSLIEATLTQVFRQGRSVIVQDLYSGFRERTEEVILLVELTGSDTEDGVYVVKLGPAQKLQDELDGWNCCRPAGLRHDLVLMSVEPRRDPDDGSLIALVYTDAQQLIGVDETLSLESALLDSARLGVPTPESVADSLFQLYERLGLLLYRTSYVENPDDKNYVYSSERLDKHLPLNLSLWNAKSGPAFECRALTTTFTEMIPLRDQFRDPVSFLTFLGEAGDQHRDRVRALVPRILRGHSHGDLHGRNVLIGRVGDRVLWPAVFDFGDMGRDNLIARDFVKLETEFKIRAYPQIFTSATTMPILIPEIVTFERELAEWTELCRDTCQWPNQPRSNEPRDRFSWLILKIRQQAQTHLGIRKNRSRDWLAEYYFLLTVYALSSVRFNNLTPIEFLGAYLASGTACARYRYDRESAEDAPNR